VPYSVKGFHKVFKGSPVSAAVSVYIGQTGVSVDIRLKEHQPHIRLDHPDKSAVAEQSIDEGHCIQFHNSSILAMKTRYMHRITREALRLNSTPTISTERAAFVSVNHGSLLSAL
jgi:hypothetical protein